MIEVRLTGRTYSIKETLKENGFRWNPATKAWSKTYDDSDKEYCENLAKAWTGDGVYVTVSTKASKPASDERKYMVKENWIFNLESMHDKLWVIENDLQEGRLQFPFEVAGKQIKNYDDLEDLRQESYKLEWVAKSRKVTGKEYGRIRAIVCWRVVARYNACMAAGMSESEAGKCFEEI